MMLRHFEKDEQQQLRHRLGHLALFNPIFPDGSYRLDLGYHEQASVAKLLLLLSVREPGENIENETFNGKECEIPKEWLVKLPSSGVLCLMYTTEKEEDAMMDLRRSLAEDVLGWSFSE